MASPDEGPQGPDGPEWADEDHLDEVFSTWVPGPHESASAAEREMAGDDAVPGQDMEAALAAALAEAEGAAGPPPDHAEAGYGPPDAGELSPPGDAYAAPPAESRSEPSGPSWLRIDPPEPPAAAAPDPGPGPGPAPQMDPDPEFEPDAEFEPYTEPGPETEPDAGLGPEFDPDAGFEPEPGAASEQGLAAPPAPAPPAPRPEPAVPLRPWTRSDDDVLPGRGAKGWRR